MANTIKPFPTTSLGDPEILPWATSGTTLEPSAGQETNGWQPQAVAGPPDYRLENYARLNQSKLNARGVQTALFIECSQAQITLAGFAAGVNQRRITINAVNFDVTDATSLSVVRDAFVSAINSNAAISALVTASAGGAGILYVTDNAPGDTYSASPSLAVAVLAGAGTITVSSAATTPIVREDAIGMASDLVIGSKQADEDGVASHRRRIIWRKAKAAFRAGYFSATQADDANTGTYSIGLGRDCQAQGADAVALGQASLANATNSFSANGAGISAGATFGVAIGAGAGIAAAGTDGLALGSNATVTQPSGVAIGNTASSSATSAVAVGTNSSATAANALAMMGGSATGSNTISIGAGVAATTNEGAFASGRAVGTLQATGIGSRAHGYAGNTRTLEATGNGASATGYTASTGSFNNVQATGNGAFAHGYNSNSTVGVALLAQGENSRAIGAGSLASADFSAAIGYGAKASNRGEEAQAAAVFDNGAAPFPTLQRGSAQKGSFHAIKRTTDATADQVMTPGAGTATFTPLADTVYMCDAQVIAKEESTDDSYAAWAFKFTVAYVAGALTVKHITCVNGAAPALGNILAGNAITHFDDGTAGGAAWVLKCDTIGGDLRFKVTGAIGKNIRWSARCDYVAVGQHV